MKCDTRIALTSFSSILEGHISSNLISPLEGLTAVQLAGLKCPSELPWPQSRAGSSRKWLEELEPSAKPKYTQTKPSKPEKWFWGSLWVESKHRKWSIMWSCSGDWTEVEEMPWKHRGKSWKHTLKWSDLEMVCVSDLKREGSTDQRVCLKSPVTSRASHGIFSSDDPFCSEGISDTTMAVSVKHKKSRCRWVQYCIVYEGQEFREKTVHPRGQECLFLCSELCVEVPASLWCWLCWMLCYQTVCAAALPSVWIWSTCGWTKNGRVVQSRKAIFLWSSLGDNDLSMPERAQASIARLDLAGQKM